MTLQEINNTTLIPPALVIGIANTVLSELSLDLREDYFVMTTMHIPYMDMCYDLCIDPVHNPYFLGDMYCLDPVHQPYLFCGSVCLEAVHAPYFLQPNCGCSAICLEPTA
jgi:hypothetical protein